MVTTMLHSDEQQRTEEDRDREEECHKCALQQKTNSTLLNGTFWLKMVTIKGSDAPSHSGVAMLEWMRPSK